MNVLLITFSFPPAGGVGVLRALSLSKYLPEENIRVDVLTARNAPAVGKDLTLLAQVPQAVTVHRTWTLDLPFALRKTVKRLLGGAHPRVTTSTSTEQNSSVARDSNLSAAGRNPLRRLVANLLLPDPQIGWLPFALPAARRLIRRRAIDAVIITVPPFSSAALVKHLRRHFPKLPIIIDFRDEWLTTTLHLVSFNKNERAAAVAARTEAEAVNAASSVVLVTEAARNELLGRYPHEPREKFVCIPNGFDREPKSFVDRTIAMPAQAGTDRLTITYIGTVYGSTDPRTLVAAVQKLSPELRARLRLRFVGHIERQLYRDALVSLGDVVELRGFLPQAEALHAINSTDWLLLITHDRINVAAKFYDYVAGGRPILAAVHPDGDVRRLLEQTGTGVWCDVRDPDAIAALLCTLLEKPQLAATLAPNAEEIARFHRRALTHRYAALLYALVPRTSESTHRSRPELDVTHPVLSDLAAVSGTDRGARP